jgi:N,N'-diacetylchitobiose transport system substrate-binding protein
VAGASALALMLAACGGDDNGDDVDPGTPETGEEDGTDPGALSGEITVWIMGDADAPVGVSVGEMAEAFEAQHDDVSITVEYIPWTAGKDHYTNAIIAGDVPDLAESGNTWTPEFAEEGALAEVDLTGTEYVQVLEESATFNGATYGYPWYGGSRFLLYRTDVFDDLGLDAPDTWQDLLDASETIAAETDMAGLQLAANNQHYFLPLIWQAGGDIATGEGDSWTAGVDSDAGRTAFEYFDTIWQMGGHHPDAPTDDYTSAGLQEGFVNEDSAMLIALPWQVPGIVADNPDLEGNLGAVLLPEGPGGSRDTLAGGSHLVVFEESPERDLAAAFAEFMISPEQATAFAADTGFFPGTVAEAEAGVDQDDWLSPVAADQFINHARAYPVAGWWGVAEGAGVVRHTLQELMGGALSPDEAATALNDAFQDLAD